jgi:ParB/RepB/Spo0J family partition protein
MSQTMQMIPLDKIDIGDGFNPRRSVDLDPSFVQSVDAHGVLTPILVHPQGSGEHTRYFLVAGERRLCAARELELTEIPAVVRTEFATGNALPAALVENMHRAQLTPIEEAHAFQRALETMTADELAAAVARSTDTIRDRVALLELPPRAHELLDEGTLTLRAAAALRKLAPAGPVIVAKAAEMVAKEFDPFGEPVTAQHLEESPDEVIGWALEEIDEKERPFIVDLNEHRYNPKIADFGFPDKTVEDELAAKAKQIPEPGPNYSHPRANALKFTAADVDAARAYGCLLEFEKNGRGHGKPSAFCTDPVWLADRIGEKLDKAIKSEERKAKKAAKSAGGGKTESTDREKAERARVRAENAERNAAMLAARERNISLGIALYKGLHAPEVTMDTLRPIAALLLQYAGADLGRRGLRFVDENAQSVTTKKNGEISKVSHRVTNEVAQKLLARRINGAKTPAELVGVLLQAMCAARFADVDAAVQNDRYGHVRGLDSDRSYGADQLGAAIDAIAEPHLPADVVEQLRERRAQMEEERDGEITEAIKGVREGWAACSHCGNPSQIRRGKQDHEWQPCECTDEEIRAAILSCPSCGEPDCEASCSGFEAMATVDEEEHAEEPEPALA